MNHSLNKQETDTRLTEKAEKIIKTNKPKNAIILAAGFGMRMVPINTSVPKALLEVNGEKLIERIIRQLRNVSIDRIYVVVGYMADLFAYLEQKYEVELIFNEEYALKNNISSLNLTLDRLGNTYIVPCDLWCDKNPFHKYEFNSWYMVNDLVDPASDVRVNRKLELCRIGSSESGNGMIGICYLTESDSIFVKNNIRRFAHESDYADKFWEEALYQGTKMIVQARVVHASDVVEINTYEELRELDADSNQLKSDAIETIKNILHCQDDEITNIEILKKGMTNRSFLFSLRGNKYIMRIPGEGTDMLIDRDKEYAVYEAIKGEELCDDPILLKPDKGYKITRFIEGIHVCDAENREDVKKCMSFLKNFHERKIHVGHKFDIFSQIAFYEGLWGESRSSYPDYDVTKENVFKLRDYIEKQCRDFCLTHIDAVPDNFLLYDDENGSHIQLIDWEYAGMQDPHVDIAMFAVYALYDKQQVEDLIDIYFEGKCDDNTRIKIYCYIAASGLLWSNWCEYKRTLGVEFGEYSNRQYQYAKEYYRLAVSEMARLIVDI